MDAPIEREVKDGTSLLLRPIVPEDKEALQSAFERLSPESRYRRFFAPLARLSPTDLRYLTELDHSDHEAIVAIEPETDELVGVARYVRSENPEIAEVAVTIVDDWQHRGVATALLEELVRRARAAGISHFVALILEENDAAVELFKQLAANDAEPRRSASGNLELLIELPDPDDVAGSTLGRALAAAAHGVQMNPWRLLKQRVHETAEHRTVADHSPPEDPAGG